MSEHDTEPLHVPPSDMSTANSTTLPILAPSYAYEQQQNHMADKGQPAINGAPLIHDVHSLFTETPVHSITVAAHTRLHVGSFVSKKRYYGGMSLFSNGM